MLKKLMEFSFGELLILFIVTSLIVAMFVFTLGFNDNEKLLGYAGNILIALIAIINVDKVYELRKDRVRVKEPKYPEDEPPIEAGE